MTNVVSFDGDETQSTRSDKRYCNTCGKPLGATVGRCFEHGGTHKSRK
jgi:hypothetical protein